MSNRIPMLIIVFASWLSSAHPASGQSSLNSDEGRLTPEQAKQLGRLLDRDWKDKPEWAEMAVAILKGTPMTPVTGWWKPSESQYDWRWLRDRFDADDDRAVTLDELGGESQQERMRRLDRNSDGILTGDDFNWSITSPYFREAAVVDQLFNRLDTDTNGKVSKNEFLQLFERADPEGLGFLSPDDLRTAMSLLTPQALAGSGPSEEGGGGGGMPDQMQLLQMLLRGELGNLEAGPEVGDVAPDFELRDLETSEIVKLSSHQGDRIVLLNFGSFT